jgi:hypothetical protein
VTARKILAAVRKLDGKLRTPVRGEIFAFFLLSPAALPGKQLAAKLLRIAVAFFQ